MRYYILVLVAWAFIAQAITLEWDPVVDDDRVVGYEIHYGQAPGVYDVLVQADQNGVATDTAEITGLAPGTYYFAARSKGQDGVDFSEFSNEVDWTATATIPADPEDGRVFYWREEPVMADRFWIEGTSGNYNDTSNWSATTGGAGGASIPGTSDNAIWDGNGLGDCLLNVAMDVLSVDVQSGYSGDLDFANSAYAHSIGGNATFAGSGEIDCGDATITISGDFDYKDQTAWVGATSGIIMDGVDKIITGNTTNRPYHLTFNESATISSSTSSYLRQNSGGDLTVATGKTLTMSTAGVLNIGGDVTVNGTIDIVSPGGGRLWLSSSNLSVSGALSHFNDSANNSLNLEGNIDIAASTIGILTKYNPNGARTIDIDGDVAFQKNILIDTGTGSVTLNNSGNYNLTFQGDVAHSGAGSFSWTKGTGLITLSGTADQEINFNGMTVEDIEIDKTSGSVTLTGNVITDSFTGTDGTLDIDGNDLETTGNFAAAAGTVFNDTAGGGLVTVGGNFDINGISGTAVTWNGLDLDVTGTADADWTVATNSDASAGTEIDATTNCTDGAGNTNWLFSAAAEYPALLMIDGQIKQYVDESPNAPLCLETNGSVQAYSVVTGKDPLVLDAGAMRVLAAGETLLH